MDSDAPPKLPAPLLGLVKYIAANPETAMVDLIEPYRKYEAYLRQAFAQDASHELLKDPHVNLVPLFTEETPNIKIRARNLESESEEEAAKYVMLLPADLRRPNDSPAVVQSFKEFQRNFNVFSESSLVELDFGDNVVAAGSSVVNCLLPVPKKYNSSKRGLREFYHEKFSPASDVDLFLYGLTEEQAIEKIKEIEARVRDSLLTETTTVRTKHAVTICSQYPTRHIQIVLRIYKSVSEILTGFDIDCSGAAYDGNQVYCTPRALQSYMTQINHIDLTRRSPSYENRLSKYSHRGFEVYWPELDRSRVDPTIFERSFQRTLGLARLLVLEQLPTSSARASYLDKRREERGRPPINRFHRNLRALAGNIKEEHEDEVAEWVNEEEVSNYHTFAIPYGQRFHAKKIEKLCYTRDLLLNAEWNQPDDRDVYLHRHPAFFGRFEDVVHDCCGYCPVPKTEEEKESAELEDKIYVSGKISFIKDDPGRQSIGSFNPLTDDDWTEMAYVGNTARLCQAIVDGDVEHVEDWLAQEGADPNTRDYTGRTPLHLAVTSSTPEVVRRLVDAGARLVARLADGRTALHLAATRGDVEILKILMDKSTANEAEYEGKRDKRRQELGPETDKDTDADEGKEENQSKEEDEDEESDGELIEGEDSDDEGQSMATGSFVKVGSKESVIQGEFVPDENEEEPDFYDINVIAWDYPCSALHFAIMEGHVAAVKALCQEYGADVLLPVKFMGADKKPSGALLNLVLALALPVDKAKEMAEALLDLGATSAQSDIKGVTAFHYYVEQNAESCLQTLFEQDKIGTKSAINHVAFPQYHTSRTPLGIAVQNGNISLALKLLENGAMPHVDFESWLKSAKNSTTMEHQLGTFEVNQKRFKEMLEQPLILALTSSNPASALELLERGADPNIITCSSHQYMERTWYRNVKAESALDIVTQQLKELRDYKGEVAALPEANLPDGIDTYLDNFTAGSYKHWLVSSKIDLDKKTHREQQEIAEKNRTSLLGSLGVPKKEVAIKEAITTLEQIEKTLLDRGSKTFSELYPDYDNRFAGLGNPDYKSNDVKTVPYKHVFSFTGVNDVTEARNTAYIELFEAAWVGNLERIKTLTLTSWDDDNLEAPLKIAVRDGSNHNPFSLAVFRGHYTVAKAILEIAQAQFAPEEKPKTRFRMEQEEDEEDEESVDSEDSEPRFYSEIVDGQFTIENVGLVSMKVNSRIKPLELLNWRCNAIDSHGKSTNDACNTLHHVIRNNDLKSLKFLLDMGELFSSQKLEEGDDVSGFYAFPDHEFRVAVELGHAELLAEIIRRTGAGLPLEELVKDSGVELKEKPIYYQGLTVYGKKRKDWATAGRNVATKPGGTKTSPLLIAAMAGSIEGVEWFLSDIPKRHYLDFAKSKSARDDVRLKHLLHAPGGFEGAISKWLNDSSELVIHAAILAPASKKSNELVSYLLKTYPSSIDTKATDGSTPLLLACFLGRVDFASILIDAGADQTTKDGGANNLLHAALYWNPTATKLKRLLDLLDSNVLAQMLKERTTVANSGRTPLHKWLSKLASAATRPYYYYRSFSGPKAYDKVDDAVEVLKLLLDISPEIAVRALAMLDSSGDTPLHALVQKDADPALVRLLLEYAPSLLFRENAVGRTPAEVAHDRFISGRVQETVQRPSGPQSSVSALISQHPKTFIKDENSEEPKEHEDSSNMARNWRLCSESASRVEKATRRLVSLHEANDVAKRLGQQYTQARYGYTIAKCEDNEVDGNQIDDEERLSPRPKKERKDVITENSYPPPNAAWEDEKKEEKHGEAKES
ncbi:hypothetical protein B0H63DRAFT_299088 [Podospora didyma]|uniref:Ankyrin repeat protein n=1 Tax=Podospora didyma TaxID=330526 RepID=A0AAE0K9B1_9PEZI|nr:hypothetical protein B0H63DRAFT_299088 [Podospora didyma]